MKILAGWLKKRALREEKKEEYLQNPNFCPFCGSDEISPQPFEDEGSILVWRPIYCSVCDRQWDETWELKGIESEDKEDIFTEKEKQEQKKKENWKERWQR